MKQITIKNYLTIRKSIFQKERFVGYFVVSGELRISSYSFHAIIEKGDFILLESEKMVELIQLEGECEVVELSIEMGN